MLTAIHAFIAVLAVASNPGFDGLKSIAGDWVGATSSGKPLSVAYKPMSSGTVLVETYGVGSGRETLTVFHPDNARVIATHYCAQGNQPRLRLGAATAGRWTFEFLDATNLPDPNASHLVKLELELTPSDHLIRTETYRESGKDDVARLDLRRARPQ